MSALTTKRDSYIAAAVDFTNITPEPVNDDRKSLGQIALPGAQCFPQSPAPAFVTLACSAQHRLLTQLNKRSKRAGSYQRRS